ncbi:glycosyltransferase [Novosphingobium sp.]|uniref:glycosyltransferase n=1 Tax=Novosphingobium sp. TaxID=1874826 RepID=UPI0035B23998
MIVGNRALAEQAAGLQLGHPGFSLGCDETPANLAHTTNDAAQRKAMLAAHAREIEADLRILDGRLSFQADDVLLINSLRQWQLGGIANWLAALDPDRLPTVVLILHYTPFPVPGRLDPEADEYRTALARFQELAPARRPLLFTDSNILQDQFGQLTDLPIGLLPIPHCEPGEPKPARRAVRQGRNAVFLGQARRNKGFALLDQAIERTQTLVPAGALHFRLQAVDPDFPDEEWNRLHQRLDALGAEMIAQTLDEEEYAALLQAADIVLLPYLKAHYDSQTSGVLAEALALGKPVVVPSGTWMAEQVDGHGNAELFVSGDAASLGDAIAAIANDFDRYSRAAQVLAQSWGRFHNADNLITTIARQALALRHRETMT